jgi:hypothetical protein
MHSKVAIALLLGTLAISPGLAAADHSLEQAVVEMAQTPEQHKALAKHYRAKAEEAREEARSHDAMGRAYGGGKIADKIQMQSHCKKLSEQLSTMANEYDALAKLHDAEASKAK